MIPLLSLGVPGDSVTAILLGAFIMKGITPGPMMYVTELPTVYRVFAALMDLVRGTGLAAVIATHNLDLAARMDRQLRLNAGQLEAS